jgi:cytochrome c biogenesis protein CcdA
MAAMVLALFAGMLTIAAPCTLPVLPALLGASLGRSDKARPAFITLGFVVSFAAAAVFLASPLKSPASTRLCCAPWRPSFWLRSAR